MVPGAKVPVGTALGATGGAPANCGRPTGGGEANVGRAWYPGWNAIAAGEVGECSRRLVTSGTGAPAYEVGWAAARVGYRGKAVDWARVLGKERRNE